MATSDFEPNFEEMTVAALRAYADEHSIDLGNATKKSDIIEILRG